MDSTVDMEEEAMDWEEEAMDACFWDAADAEGWLPVDAEEPSEPSGIMNKIKKVVMHHIDGTTPLLPRWRDATPKAYSVASMWLRLGDVAVNSMLLQDEEIRPFSSILRAFQVHVYLYVYRCLTFCERLLRCFIS